MLYNTGRNCRSDNGYLLTLIELLASQDNTSWKGKDNTMHCPELRSNITLVAVKALAANSC